MNNIFGSYIREKREALRAEDRSYSLRQVAIRIGIEPSYLSKIERGEHQAYLKEEKILYTLTRKRINLISLKGIASLGKIGTSINTEQHHNKLSFFFPFCVPLMK